jgi:hypothetical protein
VRYELAAAKMLCVRLSFHKPYDCHAAVCLIYLNIGWLVRHSGEYVNGDTNCRDTNYETTERK